MKRSWKKVVAFIGLLLVLLLPPSKAFAPNRQPAPQRRALPPEVRKTAGVGTYRKTGKKVKIVYNYVSHPLTKKRIFSVSIKDNKTGKTLHKQTLGAINNYASDIKQAQAAADFVGKYVTNYKEIPSTQ